MLWPLDRNKRPVPTWFDVAGWCLIVILLLGATLYALRV